MWRYQSNKTRLEIAVLNWHPGLPGANELNNYCLQFTTANISQFKLNIDCHSSTPTGFQGINAWPMNFWSLFTQSSSWTLITDMVKNMLGIWIYSLSKNLATPYTVSWLTSKKHVLIERWSEHHHYYMHNKYLIYVKLKNSGNIYLSSKLLPKFSR